MFSHPPAQANIWTVLTTDQTWISIWSLSTRNVCFLETTYQAFLKFSSAGPLTVLSPCAEIWSSVACLEGCCDKELWKSSRIRAPKCDWKHAVEIVVGDNEVTEVKEQHFHAASPHRIFLLLLLWNKSVCHNDDFHKWILMLQYLRLVVQYPFHSSDIELELSGIAVLINSFWPRDNINPYLVHLERTTDSHTYKYFCTSSSKQNYSVQVFLLCKAE